MKSGENRFCHSWDENFGSWSFVTCSRTEGNALSLSGIGAHGCESCIKGRSFFKLIRSGNLVDSKIVKWLLRLLDVCCWLGFTFIVIVPKLHEVADVTVLIFVDWILSFR